MTAPYVVLAVVGSVVGVVAFGVMVGKALAALDRDTPEPPATDTASLRVRRACDTVDEHLAAWARLELDAGDLSVAHNIAVARGMVGTLRDQVAAS